MTDAPVVTYAREAMTDAFWTEIWPMAERHRQELSHFPDLALDPDRAGYAAVQAEGGLRLFTARRAGRVVGYAWFLVRRNPHYQASVQAVQDVLYVDPTVRGHGLGRGLVTFADDALRAEGVQVVRHHVKCTSPPLGALLTSLGYVAEEVIYVRRLDR